MGSIKEDIEIVKSLIEDTKKSLISNTELSQYRKSNRTIAYKATEHLLSDYTRQKQINEEHQKINGKLREKVKELEEENLIQRKQIMNIFDNGYIPKQKIKDKIEELKIQGNYKTLDNPEGRIHFLKEESDYKIEVCEELLQESEDKWYAK